MKILVSILMIFFVGFTQAAPEYNAKVRGFYVNSSKLVLVKLDIDTPECGNTNWPFQFSVDSLVAKEWISMLLMAKSTKEKIIVGYTANPTAGGRCSVEYFYFY